MIEHKTTLQNLKGKHIKNLLRKLEEQTQVSREMRKAVLDEVNDLMREVMRQLGIDDEN